MPHWEDNSILPKVTVSGDREAFKRHPHATYEHSHSLSDFSAHTLQNWRKHLSTNMWMA